MNTKNIFKQNILINIELFSLVAVICLVVMTQNAFASNYLLNGGQKSKILYQLVQKVIPSSNTRRVILQMVEPRSFKSPTFNQKILSLNVDFTPQPDKKKRFTDKRGNKVIEVIWTKASAPITASMKLTALNNVTLKRLNTRAAFPLGGVPGPVRYYLKSTKQVDLSDRMIEKKARELTLDCKTEFDAVQKILTWVVDHMRFVLSPESYDASYSIRNGRGNCQNYSHLSASLMRVVGIPVRIVNGVTLKQPYDIKSGTKILTIKMAQSRHSWIEVYFTDLGWVPFDPQGSELFVSNRFIRIEVGIDNNETEKDGLFRWTRPKGSSGSPEFEEKINADFASDKVSIFARKMNYGPRELLLSPRVEASFTKVATKALPPPPPAISPKNLNKITYQRPFVFGNLEFPENMNFLATRGAAVEDADGNMKARKNFLAETAEYVTTKGRQYAQTFVLRKPMELRSIGLALHNFNNDGQLWIKLYQDKESMPARLVATSELVFLEELAYSPGYRWVDFRFPSETIKLSPGRYWAALGFTGSPVVNWFFTYGHPDGPEDGTRYKTIFDTSWSRSLSFEFNYRVQGLTGQ